MRVVTDQPLGRYEQLPSFLRVDIGGQGSTFPPRENRNPCQTTELFSPYCPIRLSVWDQADTRFHPALPVGIENAFCHRPTNVLFRRETRYGNIAK